MEREKPVAEWTDDDARAVMAGRTGHSLTDAERTAMAEREREFFRRRFGDGPARHDATGRLMPATVSGLKPSGRRTRSLAGLLGFL